jgi:sensor histidine kinase YesM
MNWLSKTESFRAQLLRIMWLNFAIALALALAFWAAHAKINHHSLSDELIASLVHSAIYGLLFGLAMPYLGERLAIIRAPWNWASIIGAILFIAVTSTLLVELSLLGLGFLSLENFWQEYFFKSLSVFFIALIIGSGINIYEKFRDRIQATNLQLRTQELEKERALKLVSEARLASLESRLHPHFLFNTLNSISALISEDPKLADEMVQRLASLLRTTLDACQQSDLMTLDKEIKLVTDYLEIEKVRFRERLRYSIDVEPAMMSVRVPPIILQPVVENSIKFAVSPKVEGGSIRISARREKNELVLEVWDNGTGFTSEMIPTGHGLDNLQSRLNTLFGEKAKLAFDSQNGETSVSVSIPLNGHQEIK